MASKSETGHAKIVANFEDLITRVESLGAAYNPSKAGILLPALKAKHAAAVASMTNMATVMPPYSQAVDARKAAFDPLNKLVTRALNMLKASVDNPAEVESAASLVKKIRGGGAAKKETPEGAEQVKQISVSQRSYDMVIANLQQFIEVLSANTMYNPNEDDLKVASLTTLLADLQLKSQAVTVAEAGVNAARAARNYQLYNDTTGLADLGSGVKTYVKGAFTPTTAQYQPILSLDFRKPTI